MAGRFLFRNLSSRMSRSTSLLGAHSPASATAGEPVVRRAAWVWEGSTRIQPAAHHTTMAPNNSGIHGHEAGIRTFLNLFNGASAHRSTAAPNLPAIEREIVDSISATRYFSTLPCTRASKTGSPTISIPPVTAFKPASVNSAGVKRTFSSGTSTNDTAEWDAKVAECKAEVTDWFAQKKKEDDAFVRYIGVLVCSWYLIFLGFFSMLDNDTSSCEGKTDSHCQAATSTNPDVKDP